MNNSIARGAALVVALIGFISLYPAISFADQDSATSSPLLTISGDATPTSALDILGISGGGTGTGSAVTNGVYYYNGTNAETDTSLTWTGLDGVLTVNGNELITGVGTSSAMLNVNGVNNSTVASPHSMYGIDETTDFSPNSAGTPKFIFGEYVQPAISNYTESSALSFVGVNVGVTLEPSSTGAFHNFFDYEAGDLNNLTTSNGPTELYQFFALGTNNGNGTTTSGVDNRDYFAAASTAGAGLGGALSNYSFFADVPSGSGAGTTNNYALYITDNGGTGGTGTTNNYAIYSTSTASSWLDGNVGIGAAKVKSSPARLAVEGADTATTTPAFIVTNSAATPLFTVYDNGSVNYSGAVHAQQLCIGSTCVTEAQLKTLLQAANAKQ